MFSKPTDAFVDSTKDQLIDHFNNGYAHLIVCFAGKHWIIKMKESAPDEPKREFLAFSLGWKWLNIPEVKLLTREERGELAEHRPDLQIKTFDTWLVRLVQDYAASELAINDLTRAIAGELVFSLWIRRRDAHFSNRALVNGVPMFFDFHVAFAKERQFASLDGFFQQGNDAGFPNNWRLQKLPQNKEVNLIEVRNRERGRPLALQPVCDEFVFEDSLLKFINIIKEQQRDSWVELIRNVGFQGADAQEIDDLLTDSRATIDEAVARMKAIVKSPIEV